MHVTLTLVEVCQALADAALVKAGLEGAPGAKEARLVAAPGCLTLDLRKPVVVSFIDGPESLIEIGLAEDDTTRVD